jgi:hypothetical protein
LAFLYEGIDAGEADSIFVCRRRDFSRCDVQWLNDFKDC